MENEHLRAAIRSAGLTLEEFADIVGVDVKTVQRWLGGRTPHPGNRARVAGALDTTEYALWPDAAPRPAASPEDGRPVPVLTDVVTGYGHATDPGAPNPVDVVRSAVERIELIVPSVTAGIVELLLAKAAEDCQVRVILENPDGQLGPLLGSDGIEIHASPGGEDHLLYRGDEQMLLVLRRIGVLSESPPLILLQRRTSGGLFDRLVDEFEERWDDTTPLPNSERLHAHLAEVELEPWPEPDVEPDPIPPQSPQTLTEPRPDAPRRWPGRRP